MLDLVTVWTITPEGELLLKAEASRNTKMPYLPRFGLRLFLPREHDQVQYFGFGPHESYLDKHRASYIGLFEERAVICSRTISSLRKIPLTAAADT